jgi:hypothetical protein
MSGTVQEPRKRTSMRRGLVLSAVLAGLMCAPRGAHAHEWYPLECCGGKDCAAADSVIRRGDGSYLVTAHGMSLVIPDDYYWRPSPDGQVHVCVRHIGGIGLMVVCAFRSPGA